MSFEQLISSASLGDGSKPKYQSIAEDLAQAILNGQVPMGEKLPPQRNLARRLGVTTGTISRAYAILERQGLATARVGDGTYVRSAEHVGQGVDEAKHPAPIDLAHNVAMVGDEAQALQAAVASLAHDPEILLRAVVQIHDDRRARLQIRHRHFGRADHFAQKKLPLRTSQDWHRQRIPQDSRPVEA